MVIYIVSDTHGHVEGFLEKLEEIGVPDKVYFLGDYVEDGEYIKNSLEVETLIVKGNNDFKNKIYKNEEFILEDGYRILLTHGHLYDVNFDISNLYYRGLELGADLLLFGHTHKPFKIEENGMVILNPGSASYPRTISGEKTFIKLTIDNGLKYEFIKI